jgi:hypothetical protein
MLHLEVEEFGKSRINAPLFAVLFLSLSPLLFSWPSFVIAGDRLERQD